MLTTEFSFNYFSHLKALKAREENLVNQRLNISHSKIDNVFALISNLRQRMIMFSL